MKCRLYTKTMLLPQIKISLRPNNQITLTRGNYRARAREIGKGAQYYHDKIDKHKLRAAVDSQKSDTVGYHALANARKSLPIPPLGIIKKSQRSKKALRLTPHKPKSFTRFSGQRLREAGAAMSIACHNQPTNCYEITLTIPANHSKAYEAIALDSDYAVNRLFEPIRKAWGSDAHWFFVWEYQKRGALHMHIGIYHPDKWECACMAAKLREQWHKVLVDIGLRRDVCMFSQKKGDRCWIKSIHSHHIAPIRKDIGCYFSKYAGKTESKNEWYCQKFPVSRFWGSSRTIKKIVRENSYEFTWDNMRNEKEYDSAFQEIIESILEKLSIVSSDSYEFNIMLKGNHRLNRYANGKKVLVTDSGRCIANGVRYTFYTEQKDYGKALELAKFQSNFV